MLWNAIEAKAVPSQAHCKDEVEDFMKIASALLVNVGTLSPDWTEGMHLAAKAAKALGKPWVLDPVGAGATPFRTQARLGPVHNATHHHHAADRLFVDCTVSLTGAAKQKPKARLHSHIMCSSTILLGSGWHTVSWQP